EGLVGNVVRYVGVALGATVCRAGNKHHSGTNRIGVDRPVQVAGTVANVSRLQERLQPDVLLQHEAPLVGLRLIGVFRVFRLDGDITNGAEGIQGCDLIEVHRAVKLAGPTARGRVRSERKGV